MKDSFQLFLHEKANTYSILNLFHKLFLLIVNKKKENELIEQLLFPFNIN